MLADEDLHRHAVENLDQADAVPSIYSVRLVNVDFRPA
jgi:hypothetical protein